MVDFGWQENRHCILSPKTSAPSSLQNKKFVTWNSLWEHPRLVVLPCLMFTRTRVVALSVSLPTHAIYAQHPAFEYDRLQESP